MELVRIFEDIGVSGGAVLKKRKGLVSAIESLESGMALVAVKRDRIARDVLSAAMIDRLIERAGAKVFTCDGTGEGDTPEAKLARTMADAFAEYERGVIGARTKAALDRKREKNERLGGKIPYGKSIHCNGKHLVGNENEQLVIHKAEALHANGLSLRKISLSLAAQGYFSRENKPFTPQAISNMLKDL